jgi:hypothetical protein
VIALAIILLVVGLVVPCVLVIALTTIMALIVSMTIVRLVIVAITLVALMVVAILVTTVLLVARFMATCGRNMSHTLFRWLLLVLGNHLKNASHLAGHLTLLKEGNHYERVDRHHLVQVGELVLVCLRLHEEDLFTLVVPCVLVMALTTIMALIVSMTIDRLMIVTITLVALMVVAIFVTTVLLVARFMATCSRNMSHTLFLWLLLVLGNHLKNASHLAGHLTLLKEGNHYE